MPQDLINAKPITTYWKISLQRLSYHNLWIKLILYLNIHKEEFSFRPGGLTREQLVLSKGRASNALWENMPN